ncbi:hypothetical protein [Polyangium jinanense]|uniref:Uncharacterized protein n=1 Tax=Polyangium jinanense TaxID=2829994 RepID=A0A9X4AR37_9BACT|nr:hypothetical protein [Polyangium jinanense]MDC3953179.1 hypothetical protein [Polyangium jinanense]MDC3979700.1 hypothetical protein [Polyangium jinanense]
MEPKGPPHSIAKGPCAALEAELQKEWFFRKDPAERAAIADARAQVVLLAYRDPLPEEDAEWARLHRERSKRDPEPARRDFAGRCAYKGYLESTGGTFEGRAAPWDSIDREPWCAFGYHVWKAPEDEPEHETLAAALTAYGNRAGQPAPPPSEPWLAAARAVRKNFPKPTPPPSREAVMEAARKWLTSPEERTQRRRAEAEAKIRPIAPGPSAAREAELAKKLSWVEDPAEKEALMAEYKALMSRAKKDPVPEEDAEWALIHREWDQDWLREFRPARRGIAAKLAYRAYCETEGIPVDEKVLATRLPDEFYFVGDRMIDKFEEPEQETLAAVLAVYVRRTGKPPPRPSEAWLAAIRKVREVLPKPKP